MGKQLEIEAANYKIIQENITSYHSSILSAGKFTFMVFRLLVEKDKVQHAPAKSFAHKLLRASISYHIYNMSANNIKGRNEPVAVSKGSNCQVINSQQ